ncbi:UNC93-like protein MFSD11 isoform X4 [Planococcus citri]|uniref:UNC93-like protein MFSD11 isoform X4 n=1 Tax=Planococcus citri TaxID=170843 RepID=UPI0031F85514
MFDNRLLKDVYLGLCFVMVFNSFNILSSVQKTMTASIEKDNPSVHLDGYISLGIVYTALSFGMWLSPGIIAKTGPKYAMIIGTSFYFLYMFSFFTEQSLWIYLGAGICGFGGSLLWTGQANYIVLNSEIGKVYSGIGVFWILYQSSHFFGNMIIYFQFNDIHRSVDRSMRTRIVFTLLGFVVVAILMMLGIRPPLRHNDQQKIARSPGNEILKASKILITPQMLMLIATMITTGIHLTFMSILSASMSFSKYLSDNSKELAPLCGIVQGFGEISGGILSIVVGGRKICKLRPMISLALICNLISYTITFLALPNNAARFYTDDLPIMPLPSWLLVIGAVLSGTGDACLHTEMYDNLGAMYPNDSASAFAVFKFIRSIATGGSFYYGKYLGLYAQLVILVVLNVLSWILYHYVQWFMFASSSAIANPPEQVIDTSNSNKAKCEMEMDRKTCPE